jgi:hypothetical protein
LTSSPKYFASQGTGNALLTFYQATVPWEKAMLQRIDVLVLPQIEEADYAAFRTLIKLLPQSYDAWRMYHDVALRKRGTAAVIQVVAIAQFKEHLQRRDPTSATLAELLRCATNLAMREM